MRGCMMDWVPAPSVLTPWVAPGAGAIPHEQHLYCQHICRTPLIILISIATIYKALSSWERCVIPDAMAHSAQQHPAKMLCLVGTMLRALMFCGKTSREQTLWARSAPARHRNQSRLLSSACPLASSHQESWGLRESELSPQLSFILILHMLLPNAFFCISDFS